MELKIDLKQYAPKNIYMRNDKKHYLDPFRQMLVPLTAESLLLFKMETYVHQVMGVPKSMMYVNQSFRKYGVDSSKIIDVVIHDVIDNEMQPVAIIECKSPGLALYHTTTAHIENFAKKVGVNYLVVTNGNDVDSYISRQDRLSFWKIDNIPDYKTICQGHKEMLEAQAEGTPQPKSRKAQPKPSQATKFSSKSTPKELQGAIMGMLKALKDEKTKLKPSGFDSVTAVGDCGLRKKLVGFGSEKLGNVLQRTFLVCDFYNSHQLMSLDISPDSYGAPILSVTLDDVDNRQVIFNLDLSKTLHLQGTQLNLEGSIEVILNHETDTFLAGLTQLVDEKAPQLLKQGRLNFGSVSFTNEAGLESEQFSEMLLRLMAFGLLLDEHRAKVKLSSKVGRRNK